MEKDVRAKEIRQLREENHILRKKKRFLEVTRAYLIIFSVILTISQTASLGVLFSVKKAYASENVVVKKFTYYDTKPGDTLISIAEKYAIGDFDEYVEEVKMLNNLDDDQICADLELIVPYYE